MLPKQQIAMFDLTVPSTGKKVKYRPFTVKEEKLLLIAQQSDDINIMVNTLKEIIRACFEGSIDADKLAVFDLEYIMATLRAKSVGETVRLQFECDKDPTHDKINLDLDLTKIEVVKDPKHKKVIPLFDKVGVTMRYPDVTMLEAMSKLEGDPNYVFGIIFDCIESVFDAEEVFKAEDITREELIEFIDGLTKTQFKLLEEFFETMPKFQHTIKYTCATCKTEHFKKIEGFANFF